MCVCLCVSFLYVCVTLISTPTHPVRIVHMYDMIRRAKGRKPKARPKDGGEKKCRVWLGGTKKLRGKLDIDYKFWRHHHDDDD